MAQTLVLPLTKYVEAIHGTVTQVTRRVEIYEQDNTTLWRGSADLGLIEGSVNVEAYRDERRDFEIILDNSDNLLNLSPGGLWYDKVVKVYRGVRHPDGTTYEAKLGEFMIDNLKQGSWPHDITITGRDFTKKLMLDKFAITTGFVRNQPVEEIIRTIATNGGIVAGKMNLPLTGKSTTKDYLFDRTLSRWEAIKQLANDTALDIYFDREGVLRLEVFTDPYLDPPQYTFQTGPEGNISSFDRSLSDSRLYNHVVVTGGTENPETTLPPYAVAENTTSGSPTSVAELGRRSYFYTSQYMTTTAQCQAVADKFLKIHALEQFDCNISSIVVPYLEPGVTVNFAAPYPVAQQPIKYLLSSFKIPLDLSEMPVVVKRVTQVTT